MKMKLKEAFAFQKSRMVTKEAGRHLITGLTETRQDPF